MDLLPTTPAVNEVIGMAKAMAGSHERQETHALHLLAALAEMNAPNFGQFLAHDVGLTPQRLLRALFWGYRRPNDIKVVSGRPAPGLGPTVVAALLRAQTEASAARSPVITCDHLGAAIMCAGDGFTDPQVAEFFAHLGFDDEEIDAIHQTAHVFAQQSRGEQGDRGGWRTIPVDYKDSGGPVPTSRGPRGTQGSIEDEIAELFRRKGFTVMRVNRDAFNRPFPSGYPQRAYAGEGGDDDFYGGDENTKWMLEFGRDLTQMARAGKLPAVVGRDAEIKRAITILCRKTKRNPALIGEPGVGKTAIAEGLAQWIVDGKVPDELKGMRIFELNMGMLVAGTMYRGEFEQRLKRLIAEFTKPGSRWIVFIDEMHTILGAGAAGGGTLDAANMLKPPLARGEMLAMGATTRKEAKKLEKDEAFARRFIKVTVGEPEDEATRLIVGRWLQDLEKHHQVSATNVLDYALRLGKRYIHRRYNPDKTIDILDEACARLRIANQEAAASGGAIVKEVPKSLIDDIVTAWSGVNVRVAESQTAADTLKLFEQLGTEVIAQDKARQEVSDAICVVRAGWKNPDRPAGCYLFRGPTGVGKTELAKALAAALGIPLHRFDMSEYMEKHTVARLIGAPPGYVGYDDGGLLTDAVDNSPHCVLLLDEIEKAHPDLFNVLLQVMDYGKLTDAQGREVDFRNVILIMTTNAGEREAAKGDLGFVRRNSSDERREEALNELTSPEFRNRLDAVITFHRLTDREKHHRPILKKMIRQLQKLGEDRCITLELDADAENFLIDKGFSEAMGGRELGRAIKNWLIIPMSKEQLAYQAKGNSAENLVVKVSLVKDAEKGDHLGFDFAQAVPPATGSSGGATGCGGTDRGPDAPLPDGGGKHCALAPRGTPQEA